MNVAKAILAALVIFAAGFVTGALALKEDPPPARTQSSHRGARNWSAQFLEKLQRELNLTAQQRERIEQILRESQERNSQQFQKEIRSIRDSIRVELTPEQLAKYEEILKRSKRGKSGDGKGRNDDKRSEGDQKKNDTPEQAKSPNDAPVGQDPR